MCAGKNGAVLLNHLHCGGLFENFGHGFNPSQRKLPEKYVEHHGLCSGCYWVSLKAVFNFPLLCEVYTIYFTWSNTFSVIFSVFFRLSHSFDWCFYWGAIQNQNRPNFPHNDFLPRFHPRKSTFPNMAIFHFLMYFFLFIPPPRWLTVIVGEEFPIDLRMLKSFRCLRPLKMVSKVPSKFSAISAHRDLAPASCRIKSRFLPRFQKKREFRRWVVNSRRKVSSDEHTHSSSKPKHRVERENKSVLDKWMSRSWWIR